MILDTEIIPNSSDVTDYKHGVNKSPGLSTVSVLCNSFSAQGSVQDGFTVVL